MRIEHFDKIGRTPAMRLAVAGWHELLQANLCDDGVCAVAWDHKAIVVFSAALCSNLTQIHHYQRIALVRYKMGDHQESPMHHVISVRRARKIAALQYDIDRLRTTVTSVLASLEALEDELERLTKARHRHLTRDALTVLRKSPEPLPAKALALRVMEMQGLDASDPKAVRRVRTRLRMILWRQERAGVVVKAAGETRERRQVWAIAG